MKQLSLFCRRCVATLHNISVWLGLTIKPHSKLKRYTFNLVGLDRQMIVLAHHREIAIRKVYAMLTTYELEELEWADLIKVEPLSCDRY